MGVIDAHGADHGLLPQARVRVVVRLGLVCGAALAHHKLQIKRLPCSAALEEQQVAEVVVDVEVLAGPAETACRQQHADQDRPPAGDRHDTCRSSGRGRCRKRGAMPYIQHKPVNAVICSVEEQ